MYFNVKTEALTEFTESFNNVFVGFGIGNEFLCRVEWNSYEAISDWQQIEEAISFDGGTLMSINIYAAQQNGATYGCHLESTLWL